MVKELFCKTLLSYYMNLTDFEKDKKIFEINVKNVNEYFVKAVDNNSYRIVNLLLSYPDLNPGYKINCAIKKACEKGYTSFRR